MISVKVLEEREGNMHCKICKLKPVKANLCLFPAKKPTFNGFGPFYLFRGSVSTIKCDPDAAPKAKAEWTRNGKVIIEGDRYRLKDEGRILEIHDVEDSDKGDYTCKATNVIGSDVATGSATVLSELLSSLIWVFVRQLLCITMISKTC